MVVAQLRVTYSLYKRDLGTSQYVSLPVSFLLRSLYSDLCRKLQHDGINDPSIPRAMDLQYPATSVVFILPWVRLSRGGKCFITTRFNHGSKAILSVQKLLYRQTSSLNQGTNTLFLNIKITRSELL